MKLGIMQPYFFPYIGYFQAIKAVDKYILYDNLNFIKEAWMNRNRYLVKDGSSCYFHLPLKEKSSFKKIKEIQLVEDEKWKKKILNSIFLNYKKSEYFRDVYPLIEYVINYKTDKLTEINYESIRTVCDYLDIKTELSTDCLHFEELEKKLASENIDNKNFPDLKIENCDRKVIRVLEICKIERANTFINAIGGTNLYSKDVFFRNGIDLKFVKTKNIVYKQFSNNFVSDLSIIDVMMFNSITEIKGMLNKYDLI